MAEPPRPFRVGVDGYNLALARGTGVATYARTLCRAVARLGHPIDLVYGLDVPPGAPSELRETLFFARLGDQAEAGAPPKPDIRRTLRRAFMLPRPRDLVEVPVSGRVVTRDFAARLPPFERLLTRGSLFEVSARHFRRFGRFMTVRMPDPPAIMHWTYPVPIHLAGAANLYTIHDLVPLRLPHASLEDKAYHERLIAACIAQAAHIVTVSEASRRDIIELFAADPAHVTNSYQAVDLADRARDRGALDRRLRRLFDLEREGYLLFFGAIEPKKNVGRLIEAYLGSEIETPLVIVGAGGWRSGRELRLLDGAHGARLAAADRVRRIEYLPRSLLIELISGARAVLFPSLYEGFGLPALEAMALGVPVLTANVSAMPEVAGDAALLVDPYDVGAIAVGLRQLDRDAALRARLSVAGIERARKFSSDRYAERLARLYARIAPAPAGKSGGGGPRRIGKPFATLLGATLLAGCAALPSSGPTAGEIIRQERSEANILGFRLVDLDSAVIAALAQFPPPAPALASLAAEGRVDRVGPGDLLQIGIFEVGTPLFSGSGANMLGGEGFDPSARRGMIPGVRVDQDGTITLPYIGELMVAGSTPAEIQRMIESRLAGKSQSPQAVVSVSGNIANTAIVMGRVRKPGRLELTGGQERLLDAIADAGGTEEQPEDLIVRFTRGDRTVEAPLAAIASRSAEDLPLLAGDRVEILRRPRSYTVFGATDRVSQVPFEAASLSLAEAVARIGGPSDRQADPSALFIFRYVPGETEARGERPTIYRLNLMKPSHYFLAQRFAMRDKDVIYIANARANQSLKLVQVINQLFTPLFFVREVTRDQK